MKLCLWYGSSFSNPRCPDVAYYYIFHLHFLNFADLLAFIVQHKDAYQVILDGVKSGPKEKRLAAQFIPKFFSSFPELADAAINAQLDLCEDEDVSVSINESECNSSSV